MVFKLYWILNHHESLTALVGYLSPTIKFPEIF